MKTIPALEILVAGDAGSAKANFIDRFLYHYPPSAEIRRIKDAIHLFYEVGGNLKIQLYVVGDRENIDRDYYKNMDAIFFCYAANDPESLQSLGKWCGLLRDEADSKGMHSCLLETKKQFSFLVADTSNLSGERNASHRLSEEANKMKETYGINRLVECSFEDEEIASIVFQTILDEVSPPELVTKSTNPEDEVSPPELGTKSTNPEDESLEAAEIHLPDEPLFKYTDAKLRNNYRKFLIDISARFSSERYPILKCLEYVPQSSTDFGDIYPLFDDI